MNKRASFTLVALCLLTVLPLAACGNLSAEEVHAQAEKIAASIFATQTVVARSFTPTPTSTSTPVSTPTSTPTTTPTPTPTRALTLASSQALHLSACCSGSDFYTLEPVMTWGPTAQIVSEAFVGLTRQNEETSEIEPGMALSWNASNGGLAWTFHLRADVPWVGYDPDAGGVEQVRDENDQVRYVTAYDFEYGILRALDPEMDWGNEPLLNLIVGDRKSVV